MPKTSKPVTKATKLVARPTKKGVFSPKKKTVAPATKRKIIPEKETATRKMTNKDVAMIAVLAMFKHMPIKMDDVRHIYRGTTRLTDKKIHSIIDQVEKKLDRMMVPIVRYCEKKGFMDIADNYLPKFVEDDEAPAESTESEEEEESEEE